MNNFEYIKNIDELANLYHVVTTDDSELPPFLRCKSYAKRIDELVRYVYKEKTDDKKYDSMPVIRLLKNKKFKQFLGTSILYSEIYFIYLAGSNAEINEDVDLETAELALENLKESTYEIFLRLLNFDDLQKEKYKYKRSINSISEAKTREIYIDEDLKNAGYTVCKQKGMIKPNNVCIEIEIHHLPNQDVGYADYVIYNRIGKPVAVIEAKKTSVNEENGAQQARDYADSLVTDLNLSYRPIIYYTNGYKIKIQDRLGYPAREVGNYASLEDLERLIKRQYHGVLDKREAILDKELDPNIIDRSKLVDAAKTIIDSMNVDGELRRKLLLVLPCGVGKTRTAVAISKVLMKNNWAENILFLADRNNLVDNARKPFEKYIEATVSDISAENPKRDINARICLCTYNSMLNMINKPDKEFSVCHFDLIFVDEAHRSLFNVYRAIFEYFDSFVIGLTATPNKEIDRSTYEILDLDVDKPTYEIKFEEAVNLDYLVSYRAFDKTSELMKNGVKYKDLTDAQKDEYEKQFGDASGNVPDEVSGKAFYRDIFNKDTIYKMFNDLFTNGLRIDNGNKLGKTLIFAVDHNHALKIVECFKDKYAYLGDDFCQVIDTKIEKNKTRQDNFAKPDSNPQIVVSVDMMDTGVDIPEIVNLVFYKKVLSKIKFDQMCGRGTRTCKNLNVISPNRDYFEGRSIDDSRIEYTDKQGFFIFDYCNNFEFFDLHPDGRNPSTTLNLNQKMFSVKLDTLYELQTVEYQSVDEYKKYYSQLKVELLNKIKRLDKTRIDVRNKLDFVDKYNKDSAFDYISQKDVYDIKTNILKLIDQDSNDDIYEKSFDYKVSIIQLSLLKPSIDAMPQINKLMKVTFELLQKGSIGEVLAKKDLLIELSSESFYENLDFFTLEKIKEEIGPLVKYIKDEKSGRLITNFNDSISTKELDVKYNFDDFKSYREKFTEYLKKHFGELESVKKIMNLDELDTNDLTELQTILNSLKNENTNVSEEFNNNDDLIVFIRQIVGINKKSIDEKCAEFLNLNDFNKEQRQLINLIIDFAIRNGNITNSDLVNLEPFSEIEIPEIFNYNVEPIKRLVSLFTKPLEIRTLN